MPDTLYIHESKGVDPHGNLALEEYFLSALPERAAMLFLWQNAHTVVIGRNQSARRECDLHALRADGGTLARRLSGGGAVYHDLGNVNYTLLLRREDDDAYRRNAVVSRALRAFGIQAECSGRNDMTVNGRKFSGSAYVKRSDRTLHHGTLMLSVDVDKLQKYLLVSDEKLRGKGVSSVRARVTNLCDICPRVTARGMMDALTEAFCKEYAEARRAPMFDIDENAVRERKDKFSSDDWLYGVEKPYDRAYERRFPFGAVRLELSLDGETITGARAYSDGMDADGILAFADALRGATLSNAADKCEGALSDWLREVLV